MLGLPRRDDARGGTSRTGVETARPEGFPPGASYPPAGDPERRPEGSVSRLWDGYGPAGQGGVEAVGASSQHIFLLVGPSGVGKNTLMQRVLERNGDLEFVPSITTRPPRAGESPGKPYFFVTPAQFQSRIETGDFLEYQNVHGHLYGTSKTLLLAPIAAGRSSITDIDILGSFKAKSQYPHLVVTIFIRTSTPDVLRRRLLRRDATLSGEELDRRMARVELEMSLAYACDAEVVNDDEEVEDALSALEQLVKSRTHDCPPTGPARIVRILVPAWGKELEVAQARGETAGDAVHRAVRAAWWEQHPDAVAFDIPAHTLRFVGRHFDPERNADVETYEV